MTESTPQIDCFETERLFFSPLSIEDSTEIQQLLSAEVFHYVPEVTWPFDVDLWINEKTKSLNAYLCHSIRLSNENTLIGFVQLLDGADSVRDDYYAIELGYWLGEDHWSKGYCSETLEAITVHIIEHNNWTQEVIALVYDGNAASEKILAKVGFKDSGVRRRTRFGEANVFIYESEHYKQLSKNLSHQ